MYVCGIPLDLIDAAQKQNPLPNNRCWLSIPTLFFPKYVATVTPNPTRFLMHQENKKEAVHSEVARFPKNGLTPSSHQWNQQ